MPKHDETHRLVMTLAEKAALARLAERDGNSQAGIIRRLTSHRAGCQKKAVCDERP